MPLHGSDKCGEIHTYHIYPLAIIVDRYNGTYSEGSFTAWNLHPETIPDEIYSDDCTCFEFWNEVKSNEESYEYRKYHNKFGVGNTIQAAIDDLYKKLPPDERMVEVSPDEWKLEKFTREENE